MSYERSPREVCSTTIGTRFKPRSFMVLSVCLSGGLAKACQFTECRRLIDNFHLPVCPVDSLVFQCRSLQLLHGLAAGQILAARFGRIRMRCGNAVQALLHPRAIDLEVLRAHDLADQQSQRDALARAGFERFTARNLLRILYAGAPSELLLHFADLILDHALGHFHRIVTIERIEQLIAHACANRTLHLALHAGAHLDAQLRYAALGDTEGAHELFIDHRQRTLLHGREFQIEFSLLAGHRRGTVIVWKPRWNRLRLARLHADERLFDLAENAFCTEHDLHGITLAAREHGAVDATLIVDGHAITVLRGALDHGEDRPLRTHALEHRIHILFGDACRRTLDRDAVHRFDGHLRHHLEHRGIAQLATGLDADRLDARACCRPHALLAHRLGKCALHQLVDRLGSNLIAELLAYHRIRHLARTKSFEAHGACQLLEPLIHLVCHPLARYGHFESPLQTFGRSH